VLKPAPISIVIPVYNEAESLRNCLEAIASQTVMPCEVIVVDNNSTDTTKAVALSYSFVTVIREPRQGVVHARTTGFNAAKGEIIGRIDADTIIAPNWVETVQSLFSNPAVGAISGSMTYYHAPWAGLFNAIDAAMRQYLAWSLGKEYALQGANMAVRREAWLTCRNTVCYRSGLHEDFDLSIHLREMGYTTHFTPMLRVAVAFRQVAGTWAEFARYALLNPGTYAQHGRKRRVVMYPVILLAIAAYPLLHVLYNGYDASQDQFSWVKFWSGTTVPRVNPATFGE